MKLRTKSSIAFLLLLIPIVYLLTTAFFGVLASILEQSMNRDGLYVLFAAIAIFLLLTAPLIVVICSIGSLAFQVMAYKSAGLRITTVLMTVASFVFIIVSLLLAQKLLIAMMFST